MRNGPTIDWRIVTSCLSIVAKTGNVAAPTERRLPASELRASQTVQV